MLTELFVSNLALVDSQTATFGPGLNVVTGETGAGKSLIVGSLSLALGARASADLVRRGADAAEVVARFEPAADAGLPEDVVVDGAVLLRRVVSRDGRSRAYLNDRPVTVTELRRVGSLLADLHGQHDEQRLLRDESHLMYLDAFAQVHAEAQAVEEAYTETRAAQDRLDAALDESRAGAEELEFHRFQLQELEAFDPRPGEDETLDQERRVIAHAGRLAEAGAEALQAIEGGDPSAVDLLSRAARALGQAASLDAALGPLAAQLDEVVVTAQEVGRELQAYGDQLDSDPASLERLESRLAALQDLRRKHRAGNADELLAKLEQLQARVAAVDEGPARLEQLEASVAESRSRLALAAAPLTAARRKAATRLGRSVSRELATLGMPDARFRVELAPVTEGAPTENGRVGPRGAESARFTLAANRGESAGPLGRIASGGEVSRVMLALKTVLRSADPVSLVVFDEVDAGIGGLVADAVGDRLARVAEERQVLVVTHLAVVAGKARHHLSIEKTTEGGRTRVALRTLTGAAREDELARMLAGRSGGGERSPDGARVARRREPDLRGDVVRIFMLDNYDSFTYNLVQYLSELGAEVDVERNDRTTPDDVVARGYDAYVVSPGPGVPADAGITRALIERVSGTAPLLGVCLGHQALGEVFGARVVRAGRLMHGKTSPMHHDGDTLFRGLEDPFPATRYHSLLLERESVSDPLRVIAWTAEGEIMGIRHRTHPSWGVQFHPESILSVSGKDLLGNFLRECGMEPRSLEGSS